MSEKKPSELVAATMALDEELANVEHLTESAARVPLSSRRNLEKAARTTTEAAEAQTRVGERIQAMMTALTEVRLKNEATVQALQVRSSEIQERHATLSALLERFESIGKEAREITEMTSSLTGGGETSEKLNELETRMAKIAEDAKALGADAEAADWSDVARDADSLRQQVLAAKNKLGLLAKRFVGPN
jgi:hypothetical protein